MTGFISYLILIPIYLVLLGFSFVYIYKHPGKLKLWQENLILIFIAAMYWANFFEKLPTPNVSSEHFHLIHPLANLSPTLFTITTVFIFVPRKYRTVYYALVGIMAPAMMLAGIWNSISSCFGVPPWLYVCMIFDILAHLLFAVFGFYIYRNRIIEFNKKQIISAISVIAFFVVLVIVLNVIFDTDFYGLNFNGKHNIYNIVITSNSWLSNGIYLLGLSGLITLGVFTSKRLMNFIERKVANK